MVNITTTDLDNPEYYIQRHKKGWKIVHSKKADKLIKQHGKGILQDKIPSLTEFSKADQKKLMKANMDGGSILSGILEKVKHYTNKVKDIAHKVVHGRGEEYPPLAKAMIDKYRNEKVVGVSLHRAVLSSVYTTLMSALTNGETARRLMDEPKDKLFHISMWVKLSNGVVLSCEKEEAIKIRENPKKQAKEEEQEAPVPQNTTFGEFLEKGLQNAGAKKFFGYSAKDNNCGNWIEYILRGNHIDNASTHAFIGQDTKKILAGYPTLRKFMNTITDIGGRANVVAEGGKIAKMRGCGDREPPPPPPPAGGGKAGGGKAEQNPPRRRSMAELIQERNAHHPKSKKGIKVEQEIKELLKYKPKITDAPKITQRKHFGKGLKSKMSGCGDREPPPPPPPSPNPRGRPTLKILQDRMRGVNVKEELIKNIIVRRRDEVINDIILIGININRQRIENIKKQNRYVRGKILADQAACKARYIQNVKKIYNEKLEDPDDIEMLDIAAQKLIDDYYKEANEIVDKHLLRESRHIPPHVVRYLYPDENEGGSILKKKSHSIEMPQHNGDRIMTTMPIGGMPQYTDPRPMLGGDPRTWSPHPLHTNHPNASVMSLGGSGFRDIPLGEHIRDYAPPQRDPITGEITHGGRPRGAGLADMYKAFSGVDRVRDYAPPQRDPITGEITHGGRPRGAGLYAGMRGLRCMNMRGGVIPSPPSRYPTTDPSLL